MAQVVSRLPMTPTAVPHRSIPGPPDCMARMAEKVLAAATNCLLKWSVPSTCPGRIKETSVRPAPPPIRVAPRNSIHALVSFTATSAVVQVPSNALLVMVTPPEPVKEVTVPRNRSL